MCCDPSRLWGQSWAQSMSHATWDSQSLALAVCQGCLRRMLVYLGASLVEGNAGDTRYKRSALGRVPRTPRALWAHGLPSPAMRWHCDSEAREQRQPSTAMGTGLSEGTPHIPRPTLWNGWRSCVMRGFLSAGTVPGYNQVKGSQGV